MFCGNCGNVCEDDSKFCPTCGADLSMEVPPVAPGYQQPVYQQPMYQQPVYQQPYYPAPVVPGKGIGIASMVLGIVSLVLMCSVGTSFACAVVGIVLGAIAINKAKQVGMKNGQAVAGLTCSVIALSLMLILFAFYFFAFLFSGVEAAGGFGNYM